jgi:hypothetical protein
MNSLLDLSLNLFYPTLSDRDEFLFLHLRLWQKGAENPIVSLRAGSTIGLAALAVRSKRRPLVLIRLKGEKSSSLSLTLSKKNKVFS